MKVINMKSLRASLGLLLLILIPFSSFGQGTFDVNHGQLTILNTDGFWTWCSTEFPVVGGWMSSGSPTGTGNGPSGSIWVHEFEQGREVGSWGAYDAPISAEQYNNPSLIQRTWPWGIYYVYGENKILEYGAFNFQSPFPHSFQISYSATSIPEPSEAALLIFGLGILWLKRVMPNQCCSERRRAAVVTIGAPRGRRR